MNEDNSNNVANTIGGTIGAVAKGVGIGVAQTVAPKTYGTIRQIYGIKRDIEDAAKEERKKANDLFGLND